MTITSRSLPHLVLMLLVMLCSQRVPGQTASLDQVLDQHVKSFELTDGLLPVALQRLAADYHLLVEFESLPSEPLRAGPFSIKVQNVTVRALLDIIVLSDPRYKWNQSNNSIQVYPITGKDPLPQIVLSRFTVDKVDRYDALDVLFNSPEIRSELKNTHTIRRELRSIVGASTPVLPRFSLDLQQVSVREVLNAIANASDSNFWGVVRYGENNQYLSVTMQ